jgi:signal transduction histidine kinase
VTRRLGLAARLLAAQLLVTVIGAVTLAVVALGVGPSLFAVHLRKVVAVVSPGLSEYLQLAFRTATGLAVGVGVLASLVTATAVSFAVARRLTRPVRALDRAAARLATGDYTTRMPPAGLGAEFDLLTDAFNTMAAELERTEQTRRRLLADLAHELRTPLATIEAYLEGLADGVREPTQQTWDLLASQAERLRRLTDDISLVSRAEERQLELHREPNAPNELVTAAVAAARPGYVDRGVQLSTELEHGLPAVYVDPVRIGQVLSNLLSNALRHTPPGGQVVVMTEAVDSGVRISVADSGEGIAAEHLPRVFERFYRADQARNRAYGGSGIGLAIARALVAAHDGTINAQSGGPGTGARFLITLPPATEPPSNSHDPL